LGDDVTPAVGVHALSASTLASTAALTRIAKAVPKPE
jgi:hypothetical protein